MTNKKTLEPSKIKNSSKKIYSYIIIGTILMSISSYYLIFAAELYIPGLGGIVNGLVYTIMDLLITTINGINMIGKLTEEQFKPIAYWIIYSISNIPIIYLTMKWYSRKFFKLSICQMIFSILIILFLTFTPGFKDATIFSDTEDRSYSMILFISILAGIMYGSGVGMIFKVGACTMGLDPIIKYFSKVREKNISLMLFIVSIINSAFWIFVRFFSQYHDSFEWIFFIRKTIFNPAFVGSWLFVGAYSYSAGAFYSNIKKAQLMISSKKVDEISEYFNKENFHRGHTLFFVKGGYSKNKTTNLQMIINYEEMHDVVEIVAAIDNEAFITINELKRVYDVRSWVSMTNEDKEKAKQREIKDQIKRDRLQKAKHKFRNKDKNK